MRKVEKSADGSTLSQVTKTDRFAKSGRPNVNELRHRPCLNTIHTVETVLMYLNVYV